MYEFFAVGGQNDSRANQMDACCGRGPGRVRHIADRSQRDGPPRPRQAVRTVPGGRRRLPAMGNGAGRAPGRAGEPKCGSRGGDRNPGGGRVGGGHRGRGRRARHRGGHRGRVGALDGLSLGGQCRSGGRLECAAALRRRLPAMHVCEGQSDSGGRAARALPDYATPTAATGVWSPAGPPRLCATPCRPVNGISSGRSHPTATSGHAAPAATGNVARQAMTHRLPIAALHAADYAVSWPVRAAPPSEPVASHVVNEGRRDWGADGPRGMTPWTTVLS